MKINQKKAGVALSYASQAIQILSGILYTPIMLRLLGQNEYGLYQLVYSVVSYLGLLSFGFSSSYIRFYSRTRAAEGEDAVARLNGMFLTVFLVLAALCLVCGGVMLTNIRGIFADGLTDQEYETAGRLMALMVLNLALTLPNSIFDSITTAHERFFFQKMLTFLHNLLNPFLVLPLLLIGFGSIALIGVSTGLTIAKLLLNIWFVTKKLRVRFSFRGFRLGLLREMWIFTFFIFLNMIVDQINWSVDKFLLGRFSGTVSVAVYGVAAQLNNMYIQLSTAISGVFIPQVNRIVAESDDNGQLTRLLARVGRIQFILLSLVLSGFIFLGQPFLRLWAGEEYADSYVVALLLMVPVTIPLIQNVGIEIQRAKNRHRTRSVVYLLIAVVNVAISIPLIRIWGAKGAALGTAVTMFLGNGGFMNWYYHSRIGLDMFAYWRQIAAFLPALIVPAGVGCLLMRKAAGQGASVFLASMAWYLLVFCVSMWFFGLNDEEKRLAGRFGK